MDPGTVDAVPPDDGELAEGGGYVNEAVEFQGPCSLRRGLGKRLSPPNEAGVPGRLFVPGNQEDPQGEGHHPEGYHDYQACLPAQAIGEQADGKYQNAQAKQESRQSIQKSGHRLSISTPS
jgi:hypothetical protein